MPLDAGLNLFRLEVFVAVVERSGYSAAAGYLGLAQPTVTFHVQALERLLETKLLTYRERRVQPTAAGEVLYHTAKAMLAAADSAILAIQQLGAGQYGQLRMGASIAFEQAFFFERVVGPFLRAHPSVHLSLRFGTTPRLSNSLLNHEIDLAYVHKQRLPAGVDCQVVHLAEQVYFASPQHPLAQRETVTLAEVEGAGLIGVPDIAEAEARLGRVPATRREVAGGLEVDGVQARLMAVRAGLGVVSVFVPPYASEDAYLGLSRLRVRPAPVPVEFGLATRSGYPWSPVMQAFADWLRGVAEGPSVMRRAARADR